MKDAFRTYLESREAQRLIKMTCGKVYDQVPDPELDAFALKCLGIAETTSDRGIVKAMADNSVVDRRIRANAIDPGDFSFASYPAIDLVPTLYVGDVPHRITHGTLADMVKFALSPGCEAEAPTFYRQVHRVKALPATLAIPILVVEPSAAQRSERKVHPAKAGDDTGPKCIAGPITEGRAYIEDGNHRAVAKLLANASSTLSVIRWLDR